MASGITVPSDHTELPPIAQSQNIPTNPQVQKTVNNAAKAGLKRKNRKKNCLELTFPGLMFDIEDATAYSVSGFSAYADSQKYFVEEVRYEMKGKSGSCTRVRLRPVQDF